MSFSQHTAIALGSEQGDDSWRFIAGTARVADAPARTVRNRENCIVKMIAASWCVCMRFFEILRVDDLLQQ